MDVGYYDNLPDDEYHASDAVSSTILKEMGRSAAHCKARLDGLVKKSSKALDTGRMLHCAVLEPERFREDYRLTPVRANYPKSVRTLEEMASYCKGIGLKIPAKARKEDVIALIKAHDSDVIIWDEFLREIGETKTILSEDDMALAEGVITSVAAHPKAAKCFSGGVAERSIFYIDNHTGEWCRARPDYYREDLGIVFDLKTCRDARFTAFQKDIFNYGYHISAAMYLEACRHAGMKATGFAWLAIEKEPPYAIGLYMASPELLMQGHDLYRQYLDNYHGCRETGVWPAYATDFLTIDLPEWAKPADLDD